MNQKSNPTGSASSSVSKNESIVEDAKLALGRVADQAKEQASSRVSSQKDKAVGTIDEVANAIRQTGSSLEGAGPIPDLADRAADGIERLASYVKDKNIGDIVGEVERFARREPALFLGGAFALGLLGGRFLKSSTTPASSGIGRGMGRGGYDAYESYGMDAGYGDDDFDADLYEGRPLGGGTRGNLPGRATQGSYGAGGEYEAGRSGIPGTGVSGGGMMGGSSGSSSLSGSSGTVGSTTAPMPAAPKPTNLGSSGTASTGSSFGSTGSTGSTGSSSFGSGTSSGGGLGSGAGTGGTGSIGDKPIGTGSGSGSIGSGTGVPGGSKGTGGNNTGSV